VIPAARIPRLFLGCTLLASGFAAAQTAATPAPAKPIAYSGCVTQSPTDKSTLIFSAETVCARLTGKLATGDAAAALAGHQIDLKGVLTPRTGTVSASIQVDSVTTVGKACSDTCALQPPHKRGLGGEKPGKEGGTPGATTPPPPQP
jgi:hypothetical protein